MNFIYHLLLPLFFLQSDFVQTVYINERNTKVDQDTVIKVFNIKNSSFRSAVHSKSIKNYTLLQLDTQAFQSMRARDLDKMDFALPFNNSMLEIELTSMQIFDQSFKVTTDQSKGLAVDYTPGKYYMGKLVGDPNSMVTLSVYDNEINGVISSSKFGNLNLGVSNPEDPREYILYGQDEIKDQILFNCSTTETPLTAPDIDELRPQIDKQLESRAAGCVTIDFELTNEVYKYFNNNLTASTNWITALFTGVKALYLAEGIDINIKSVYVWTTEDDYSDDVSAALSTLGSRRVNDPAFTANLVHLVRGKTCGSGCSLAGIAWLNVLCKPNNRFAVSEPIFTYDAYPSYSWSVNVLAHEMGHNMGSNHTHWCGWSGGAIDNCLAPEGSCAAGPNPGAGGGTIMSYCHNVNSIGIKFSNGFGPQPGATIRARYNAANCLSTTCGGTVVLPTCSDGIQNGTETGVDCGGGCSACNQNCPTVGNISQGKPTSQSSNYNTANSYPASMAVDGGLTASSFNHTNNETQPWWQVDLGNTYSVSSIQLTNRMGCSSCAGRTKKFKVFISNSSTVSAYSSSGSVYEYNNASGLGDGQLLTISNLTATGRYVRIWVDNGSASGPLHFAEVQVIGCSGSLCSNNQTPSISVSSAQSSYHRNSSFTMNATASDPDGNISYVEFYNGNTLLGTDNSAPFTIVVDPASASSYSITGKAFDNCNGSKTSSAQTITTTTSCSDGFKNGNETGVDCGGSCAACPQGCATTTNISQGKSASQSSNFSSSNPYPASMAVDGSVASSSFNHTNSESQPWWQVNLGGNSIVSSIEITNRTGCPSCAGRIKKFKVFVSASPVSSYNTAGHVFEYNNASGLKDGEVVKINNLSSFGQYARVWIDYGTTAGYLHLAEVKVMGCSSTINPCNSNQNPNVTVSSSSTSYPRGGSFTVNATVNDPDGTISNVEFYSGSTLMGSDISAPFNYTMSPATANSYSISAKAIDNCGGTDNSNSLTISTTVSCSDGFQNGTETGVDCGGTCTACASGCTSSINISQGKTATQSGNFDAANTYPASKAVDGSTTSSSFNHTNPTTQPWLQVNLGGNHSVTRIEITNRTGCPSCAGRTKKFKVFVSSSPVTTYSSGGSVYEYNNTTGLTDGQVINITGLSANGQYIRVWVDNGTSSNYLHLAEVRVFGCSQTAGAVATLENWKQPTTDGVSKLQVNLFPNPVKDIVNFEYSIELDADLDASVYDVSGRRLLNSKITDKKLDLSVLENGSYFIHLNYKGQKLIKKVLKF